MSNDNCIIILLLVFWIVFVSIPLSSHIERMSDRIQLQMALLVDEAREQRETVNLIYCLSLDHSPDSQRIMGYCHYAEEISCPKKEVLEDVRQNVQSSDDTTKNGITNTTTN